MKNGHAEDKTKQRTKKGLVIPVPKRSAFDQLIRNAANTPVPDPEKPSKRGSVRRPKKYTRIRCYGRTRRRKIPYGMGKPTVYPDPQTGVS